jgi:hypothetical protein
MHAIAGSARTFTPAKSKVEWGNGIHKNFQRIAKGAADTVAISAMPIAALSKFGAVGRRGEFIGQRVSVASSRRVLSATPSWCSVRSTLHHNHLNIAPIA